MNVSIKEEIFHEDSPELNSIKEELTIEEAPDLKVVIKQDPQECNKSSLKGDSNLRCARRFENKEALLQLMGHTHATDTFFQCEGCLKRFATAEILQKHVFRHSEEKPFRCNQCSLAFKKQYALTCHKATVHGAGGKYACGVCGKKFMTPFKLEDHSVKHSDEKKYKCDLCGKSVKNKGDLTKHKLFVHSEKSFRCDVCAKAFKHRIYLNKHIKAMHKGKGVEMVDDVKVKPTVIYDSKVKRSALRIKNEIKEEINVQQETAEF